MKMIKYRESNEEREKGVIKCGEAVVYFYDLPESFIADIISLPSPVDACRLSAVSTLFRLIAETDAVWDSFLSIGYQSFPSGSAYSNSLSYPSKKQLYLSLCHNPVFLIRVQWYYNIYPCLIYF